MKIISYNINGIRAGLRKGLEDWLASRDDDVICFQEVKAEQEQVDEEFFNRMGYHVAWHSASSRKGYSGVAILSKTKPDQVVIGCGIDKYDAEGRVLRADFGDVSVMSTYFPSGTSGDHRQAVKMTFLDDFYKYLTDLRKQRPKLVIAGDYNICHRAIDIHDPVRNKNNSGFLPEEREWMEMFFNSGFVDTFRHFNPEEAHRYSWWTFRAGARGNNKGWRIDYQAVTEDLVPQLKAADILDQVVHSDHCPVYLELET